MTVYTLLMRVTMISAPLIDQQAEFELFLFAEILISNREKLKESESFVLTLQKDKISGEDTKKKSKCKKNS